MLEIKELTKRYGEKLAVNKINFSVKPGEIFGFLGPNGAGKTTTIKMIVGLLKPDEGQILINGFNNQVDILEAKYQFCYVPDNPEVFEKITGYDYLQFMCDVFKVPFEEREEKINNYLEKLMLKDDVNGFISGYSHGMKQKIVIIGALIANPKVLILDEPMVGLDPKAQHTVKELLAEHCSRGNSVFFSTHVLEVAEKVCDRVAIINKGDIIALGTLEEIRSKIGKEESLENIFLELTE
ncbi:ABC transporter ATP-binding protein [Mycoplasmatota bacterium]|nr:ABC transporter ATP-binding protein [Mycoplasmatota bacterium]